MNKLTVIAIAALSGLSAVAAPAAKEKSAADKIRERLAAMTPAEREAYRNQKAMERFGGWVIKEGTGFGRVAFVNATKRIDTKWIEKSFPDYENLLRIKFVAIQSDAKVSLASANKELLRSKSEAAIFLIEDDTMPTMLVAPESEWAILNVSPLAADKPDEKKFLTRVEKEMWRTFGHLCGAADSPVGCVLSPVGSLEDLDALASKFISPGPLGQIRTHLDHIGVKPYLKTTYQDACRKGWAPQPTNEYQKAVWDKVHAAPTKPLVIAPEKTKQK